MAPREAVGREALHTQEAAAAAQRDSTDCRDGQTVKKSAQSQWPDLRRDQDTLGDSCLESS